MKSISGFSGIWAALCSVLIAALAVPAYAADKTETLSHGGLARSYVVHTPPQFDGKVALPVVLAFHGGGGNPDSMVLMTGMNTTADYYGFIAVYPAGTGSKSDTLTWNAGRCCGYARDNKTDDVGFVSTLIDDLKVKYKIDTRRVYATGISNGAQMSYRLACELSNKITAIAPVGSQRVFDTCKPKRAVPIMHVHGTADQCAIYGGSNACGGCSAAVLKELGTIVPADTWQCDPVDQQVLQAARSNGCSSNTRTVYTKGGVSCVNYTRCSGGADVTFCKVANGGHTWPGGNEYRLACLQDPNSLACQVSNKYLGIVNQDVNASALMWNFFAGRRL